MNKLNCTLCKNLYNINCSIILSCKSIFYKWARFYISNILNGEYSVLSFTGKFSKHVCKQCNGSRGGLPRHRGGEFARRTTPRFSSIDYSIRTRTKQRVKGRVAKTPGGGFAHPHPTSVQLHLI